MLVYPHLLDRIYHLNWQTFMKASSMRIARIKLKQFLVKAFGPKMEFAHLMVRFLSLSSYTTLCFRFLVQYLSESAYGNLWFRITQHKNDLFEWWTRLTDGQMTVKKLLSSMTERSFSNSFMHPKGSISSWYHHARCYFICTAVPSQFIAFDFALLTLKVLG